MVITELGRLMSALTLSIRAVASPSALPGARLKDTVTACNCPTWLIDVGPTVRLTLVKDDSGTKAPVLART